MNTYFMSYEIAKLTGEYLNKRRPEQAGQLDNLFLEKDFHCYETTIKKV